MVSNREKVSRALGVLSDGLESVLKDDPKSYGMRILATTRVVRTEMPDFYAQDTN